MPSGCKWEPRVVNGKKEGSATVYTEEGMLYAEVVFSEDKLDGVCSFYEEGALKEKIVYKKDVMNGWSVFYENGVEVMSCYYVDGVRQKKVVKEGERWKVVDVENEKNYEICRMDEERRRQGVSYRYVDGESTGMMR